VSRLLLEVGRQVLLTKLCGLLDTLLKIIDQARLAKKNVCNAIISLKVVYAYHKRT
jgi:hypothetical protein